MTIEKKNTLAEQTLPIRVGQRNYFVSFNHETLTVNLLLRLRFSTDVAAFSLDPVEDESTRINISPTVAVENSLLNHPVVKAVRSSGFVAFT